MTSIQEISTFYPPDSELRINVFPNSNIDKSKIQNSFNMEQLALEPISLRQIIREKAQPSIMNYLTKKPNVMAEDMKIIKKTKKMVFV